MLLSIHQCYDPKANQARHPILRKVLQGNTQLKKVLAEYKLFDLKHHLTTLPSGGAHQDEVQKA